MANEKKYTPEVERLLLAARGLYDAATRAKLTPGLAVALRDGVAFEKLQDTELEALCKFVRELEKLGALSKPAEPPAVEQAPASGTIETAPAGNGKAEDKKAKVSKAAKTADSTP